MEEVLVFPSVLLDELGAFEGFSDRVDEYLPTLLAPRHLSYLDRATAEEDPSYKQLIPYVVLRHADSVYTYVRGKVGGESRLHRRLSLGIGGHICREDGREGSEAYEAGFLRELAEEVRLESGYRSRIVGMVHDSSSAVGRVHFGIVHLFELEQPRVSAVDPALTDAQFRPIGELVHERADFETWSAFIIDHVLKPAMARSRAAESITSHARVATGMTP